MKYLLPFLLLFTLNANAGVIPAFDIDGNAETGADTVDLTDITSLGLGIGSTTFVFESEVGSGNSGTSRAFGFALYNPLIAGSAVGVMEIFNSSQLMGGVNFESVVWDSNAQTVDNGTVSFALLPTTVLGFYFDSDGERSFSWATENYMGNDNFGFYDQPIYSPFDLRVFASDSDLSAANADHVWISMVDIKARNAIPEPSTVLLISGALLAFGMRKREKA